MWQTDIASISEQLDRLMRSSDGGGHRALEKSVSAASFPDEFLRHVYFTACSFYHQRRFSKAQPLFAFLCTLQREEPFYWQALGLSLMADAQYEKAEPVLDLCSKLKPGDPNTHYYRGQCLVRLGRKEEAEQQLESALKHSDSNPSYSQMAKKCSHILATLNKEQCNA